MGILVAGIDHVQLTVPSTTEELCGYFYGTILGLEEIEKPDPLKKNGGMWYRHSNFELHVSIEDAVASNSLSKRHICFVVADLALAERTLRGFDVEIIPDKQPVEAWTRFYVRDPGGNRIEFAQRV